MTDVYDMLLRGQVWVKNDSKVPGRIRAGNVVRAKSQETVEDFKEDEKENRRASVLSSLTLS